MTQGPFHVLMVCTANRCRSPMAEVLLQKGLDERNVPAVVESAGVLRDGWPAESGAVDAVEALGLDLSAHRSRTLDKEMIDQSDLILGMERAHVREVAVRSPDALNKAFVLRTFAQRQKELQIAGSETVEDWISRIAGDRKPTELLGSSREEEVADPIGQPLAAFVRCRDQLREVLELVADGLAQACSR